MSILIRSRNDFITVRCSGVLRRYLNKYLQKKDNNNPWRDFSKRNLR